jgi:hypothetical protein
MLLRFALFVAVTGYSLVCCIRCCSFGAFRLLVVVVGCYVCLRLHSCTFPFVCCLFGLRCCYVVVVVVALYRSRYVHVPVARWSHFVTLTVVVVGCTFCSVVTLLLLLRCCLFVPVTVRCSLPLFAFALRCCRVVVVVCFVYMIQSTFVDCYVTRCVLIC